MIRNRAVLSLPVLALLLPAAALAYPISPNPLWSLTAGAELIVVAEVVGVDQLPYDPESGDWNSALATLQVVETLKGPVEALVQVPYPANLICPAPPRYAEGETVVAFLDREEGDWGTVSLSYGTLYPRGEGLEDMKRMIAAAIEIQAADLSPRELERRRRDWLVQAAALPGTRWHGLYELRPGADRIRSYYDRKERAASVGLAAGEAELLAAAFVEAPAYDTTLPMMLRVLGHHQDARVDRAAVGALEGLLALERPPWWTQDMLWAVLARYGMEDPVALLADLGVESWDVTRDHLRQIWDQARDVLEIPRVKPTRIDLEEYLPVGGRTPS